MGLELDGQLTHRSCQRAVWSSPASRGRRARRCPGAAGRAERGRAPPRPGADRKPEFPAAEHPSTTSRTRRWSCRSIRCRARSFRSSTSTAISRRRSPPQQFDTLVASMDPLNLQVLVNASGRVGRSAACRRSQAIQDQPAQGPDGACSRTSTSATSGPGFGQRAAQQLEADVKAGALGVGEINKGFGLNARKSRRHAAEASTIPSSIRSGRRRRG